MVDFSLETGYPFSLFVGWTFYFFKPTKLLFCFLAGDLILAQLLIISGGNYLSKRGLLGNLLIALVSFPLSNRWLFQWYVRQQILLWVYIFLVEIKVTLLWHLRVKFRGIPPIYSRTWKITFAVLYSNLLGEWSCTFLVETQFMAKSVHLYKLFLSNSCNLLF